MRSRLGPPRSRTPFLGLALALLFGGAGCSGGKPPRYPVTGKVVFPDGTPFTGGTVCFDPVDPIQTPASAEGGIQADGTFSLRANGLGDGTYAGQYKACIHIPEGPNYDPNHPPDPPIARKFKDSRVSGLEFTVEPKPNEFTITVTKFVKK